IEPAQPFGLVGSGPYGSFLLPDAVYLVGFFPAVDLGLDLLTQVIDQVNGNSIEHKNIFEKLCSDCQFLLCDCVSGIKTSHLAKTIINRLAIQPVEKNLLLKVKGVLGFVVL